MKAIFNVSFLILCAVTSQEMVAAFDDNLELSSVPHNRQKRMKAPHGTEENNDLPPLLAHNLREVHMTEPSSVMITKNGDFIGTGYAIHPYLVLAHRTLIDSGDNYGVSVFLKYERNYVPQRVEHAYPDPDDQFVVILLKDPLLLDNPVHGAFENYPNSVRPWAYHVAEEWIRTELTNLHAVLAQNLFELHFDHPTAVQITSNGVSSGPGFAIHPYIVMTRPRFLRRNYGVALRMGTKGELIPHRTQNQYTRIHEDVVVILMLDPIMLTQDASGAFSEAHYSHEAIAWVHAVAEHWKHTMLINRKNCYHANSV